MLGRYLLACVALAGPLATPAAAQGSAARWITLGTRGGPVADPERAQPANVLTVGERAYLVDAGDGAVDQLAKARVPLAAVRAVFLSHLHFDHTGGLFAVLGLRWASNINAPLAIYGPPGTRALVDGLVAGMQPAAAVGYGLPGATLQPADVGITVTEMRGGTSVRVDTLTVRAAENSHYSAASGAKDRATASLSLRFDLPDRSIVYTGDTGPSAEVERLAAGADLLVSEMIDADRTMADIRRTAPNMPAAAVAGIDTHLRAHHLTAADVGRLAAAAYVGAVVVTHFVAPRANGGDLLSFLKEIGRSFRGPVAIARDLDEY